jgi:hypothetical protein
VTTGDNFSAKTGTRLQFELHQQKARRAFIYAVSMVI